MASTDNNSHPSAPAIPGQQQPSQPRSTRPVAGWIFAAIVYPCVLLQHRGQVPADTKSYLYIDPARLLSRAPELWDSHIGLGTITHQNIGYLWPMGPWYWLFDKLGFPDWVAQRVWIATLLVMAATGVLYLGKTLGLARQATVVAAFAYGLSPYLLNYVARISALLLPWAGLGWMMAFAIKASRSRGWKWPAAFALLTTTVGTINLPSLLYVGVGAVAWLIWAWRSREITARRATITALKIAALTAPVCLWWLSGLYLQGKYSLPILKYTETVQAVASTSSASEVIRGLGYWFFYGRDKLGPWIEASGWYGAFIPVLILSFALTGFALLGATTVRWRRRNFFVGLLFFGMIIAVGAHPFKHPAPIGAAFKAFATSSLVGLAMRSTGRAVPLIVLATSFFLGVGVTHVANRFPDRSKLLTLGVCAALFLNLPPLYRGQLFGNNLQRPENLPNYWVQAAKYLDNGDSDTRLLELPGADFASYRWGNTVDPITPGLLDRPYVARELVPYGSSASANLMLAFDRRLQENIFEPETLAPIARILGVQSIIHRADLQYERYNTPRPKQTSYLLDEAPGVTLTQTFGSPTPNVGPKYPLQDEYDLGVPQKWAWPAPVSVYSVADPDTIFKTQDPDAATIVAGDGDGLVSAAAEGLVSADDPILYEASFASSDQQLIDAIPPGAPLIITDSNRKRGLRWSTVRENAGYTEQAGLKPLASDIKDVRLDVFPSASDPSYTTATLAGARSIQATDYGNTISYTPEDRAALAFDGDPRTAWRTGAFSNPQGEAIQIELDKAVTTDHITLLQPINGAKNRYVTRAKLIFSNQGNTTSQEIELGEASRSEPGEDFYFPDRSFDGLRIEIISTNFKESQLAVGLSASGFAEISIPGVSAREIIAPPTRLLGVLGQQSASHPLTFLLDRQRSSERPPRDEEEQYMSRVIEIPTERDFTLSGKTRLSALARDEDIDLAVGDPVPNRLEGKVDPTPGQWFARSSGRLPGALDFRARSAFDGDPNTAWAPGFGPSTNSWVELGLSSPLTFDHLDLSFVNDARFSTPKSVMIESNDGDPINLEISKLEKPGAPGNLETVRLDLQRKITSAWVRVTITATFPAETLEYFSESDVEKPVAIAEVGIPGFSLPAVAQQADTGCRSDLLFIDSKPLPVRATGSTSKATAIERGPLSLELCDPTSLVHLEAGRHTITTAQGRDVGVDIDRIVLKSPLPAAETTVGSGSAKTPLLQVSRRGSSHVQLSFITSNQSFWLVAGESYNLGWQASINGHNLGEPTLINGFANGWKVDPRALGLASGQSATIRLDYGPQKLVDLALRVSAAFALLCLALVLFGRNRPANDSPEPNAGQTAEDLVFVDVFEPGKAHFSTTKLIAVLSVVALAGGVVPFAIAGLVALGATRLRRGKLMIAVAPFSLCALAGISTLAFVVLGRLQVALEWVENISFAHTLGWGAAGTLLLALAQSQDAANHSDNGLLVSPLDSQEIVQSSDDGAKDQSSNTNAEV